MTRNTTGQSQGMQGKASNGIYPESKGMAKGGQRTRGKDKGRGRTRRLGGQAVRRTGHCSRRTGQARPGSLRPGSHYIAGQGRNCKAHAHDMMGTARSMTLQVRFEGPDTGTSHGKP